jgi:Alginate lyase
MVKRSGPVSILCSVLALVLCTAAGFAQQKADGPPRVFLLDGQKLLIVKAAKSHEYDAAVKTIESAAKRSLSGEIYSVTAKSIIPPSGDKHDYMSQAPYFWPDPKSKDGLPYIRRDGERNPEIEKIADHKNMDEMVSAVENLALAYYLRGDEAYAARAVALLRAWFLDPGTKMNPNLNFGQGIPGVTTGRGIGLIETRWLPRVCDTMGLLAGSKALTAPDKKGIEEWFDKFLSWMEASKNGRDEAAAENNHGTFYDVQVASFALFLGRTELARNVLETAKKKRIARQVEPDGSQPLELERTKGWSYSVMNLEGLIILAELGEKAGVDLWNYRTPDGRGIRGALEYLYPFSTGAKWKHQQIGEWQPQILFPLMRRAAGKYTDAKFKTMMEHVPEPDTASREYLLNSKIDLALNKIKMESSKISEN